MIALIQPIGTTQYWTDSWNTPTKHANNYESP